MPLLTVRAAAKRMGIGYSTLKQWIYQGNIRTTQTAGGHHRLSEVEIDRFRADSDRWTARDSGLKVPWSSSSP
jgi:excisionase family DNA binding protein